MSKQTNTEMEQYKPGDTIQGKLLATRKCFCRKKIQIVHDGKRYIMIHEKESCLEFMKDRSIESFLRALNCYEQDLN